MAKKPASDDAPAKYEIDILAMELEQNLPHWLHPVNRYPSEETKRQIRDKHRSQHLAKQKKKRKAASWIQVREAAESTLARLTREYDESKHPRDEHGKWTESGGDGDKAPAEVPKDKDVDALEPPWHTVTDDDEAIEMQRAVSKWVSDEFS